MEGFDPSAPATEIAAALKPAVMEFEDELPFFSVNAPEDLLQASALLAGAE